MNESRKLKIEITEQTCEDFSIGREDRFDLLVVDRAIGGSIICDAKGMTLLHAIALMNIAADDYVKREP